MRKVCVCVGGGEWTSSSYYLTKVRDHCEEYACEEYVRRVKRASSYYLTKVRNHCEGYACDEYVRRVRGEYPYKARVFT